MIEHWLKTSLQEASRPPLRRARARAQACRHARTPQEPAEDQHRTSRARRDCRPGRDGPFTGRRERVLPGIDGASLRGTPPRQPRNGPYEDHRAVDVTSIHRCTCLYSTATVTATAAHTGAASRTTELERLGFG